MKESATQKSEAASAYDCCSRFFALFKGCPFAVHTLKCLSGFFYNKLFTGALASNF